MDMDDKLYFIRLLVSSAAELFRKLVRRAYAVVDSEQEQRTKGLFFTDVHRWEGKTTHLLML